MNAVSYSSSSRFPGGYRWFRPKGWRGPPQIADTDYVLSTGLDPREQDLEQYTPPSNLFLEFADTPLTLEGIRAFANRFGLLGLKCVWAAPRRTSHIKTVEGDQ